MENRNSFTCPICGNTDIHSIGMLKGKLYCRRCISFKGEEVEHKPSYPKKTPIHLEYELSPGPKRIKLKHSIEPVKVRVSFVHNTPSKSKRRDLGSRPLEGIKINKEDKPLIESIKRKK